MTTNGLTSFAYKAFIGPGAGPPRAGAGQGRGGAGAGQGAGLAAAASPGLANSRPQLSSSNTLSLIAYCV